MIVPLQPIDIAREVYEKVGRTDFEEDLVHHLRHWFVFVMPGVFMTARIALTPEGEKCWHITNAVGPLPILVRLLPFRFPWITFQRSKGDPRLRVLSYDRVLRMTERKGKNA